MIVRLLFMESVVKFILFVVLFLLVTKPTSSTDEERAISRRKRYIVFPEGATLTVAFCFTVNILNMPTNIFTEVLNLGINYDLPNKTGFEQLNLHGHKHVIQRRSRRDLYGKAEILLNAMGFDGRSCVYRALCEAAQNLYLPGENLLEELLRLVFRFPLEKLDNSEPEEHRLYHWAHRMGHEEKNCVRLFPNCHFSIIDFMLGYKKTKFK